MEISKENLKDLIKKHLNACIQFLKTIALGDVETGLTYDDLKVRANVPPIGPDDIPETCEFWKADVFSPEEARKVFFVRGFIIYKIVKQSSKLRNANQNWKLYVAAAEQFMRDNTVDDLLKSFEEYYLQHDQDIYDFTYDNLRSVPKWKIMWSNLMEKLKAL